MSDTNGQSSDGSDDRRTVYADVATRLERVVDAQRTALDDIDARAMAVMRLVAALLALLVSVLSLGATLGGRLPDPSLVAILSLSVGVTALGGTLVAASVTYLGSRVVPGVGPEVADDVLTDPPTEVAHLRRVVATSAEAVRANRSALAANARRFRVTLTLLVTGLAYGTLGAFSLALPLDGAVEGTAFGLLTAGVVALSWFVLTGRYLTDVTVTDGAVVTTGLDDGATPYPLAVVDRGGEE